jgi:hypothetical protein
LLIGLADGIKSFAAVEFLPAQQAVAINVQPFLVGLQGLEEVHPRDQDF